MFKYKVIVFTLSLLYHLVPDCKKVVPVKKVNGVENAPASIPTAVVDKLFSVTNVYPEFVILLYVPRLIGNSLIVPSLFWKAFILLNWVSVRPETGIPISMGNVGVTAE